MDVAALRERMTVAYRRRRDQAKDLVDRIPIFGRLLNEFVRIEFIDRCMLIAAQGLLALIPMLVVVASFFPDTTSAALDQFSAATGLGGSGENGVEGELDISQIRAQTGLIGLAITIFSATSFARAIQRMYERIWELRHVGGVSGARRCFLWLIGWLVTLQLVAGLRKLLWGGLDGLTVDAVRLGAQMVVMSAVWLVTSRLLLFGRVPWRKLALGALITGVVEVLYSHASGWVMPHYVASNANQFGTLGIILAIATWLIGFGAILVGSALIGRVVSEDPTVHLVVRTARDLLLNGWARVRVRARRQQADEPAPR